MPAAVCANLRMLNVTSWLFLHATTVKTASDQTGSLMQLIASVSVDQQMHTLTLSYVTQVI